jgi:hypothetical protein
MVTYLWSVRLLVLYAEGGAQNLEDLKHGLVEVTAFPKLGEQQGTEGGYI